MEAMLMIRPDPRPVIDGSTAEFRDCGVDEGLHIVAGGHIEPPEARAAITRTGPAILSRKRAALASAGGLVHRRSQTQQPCFARRRCGDAARRPIEQADAIRRWRLWIIWLSDDGVKPSCSTARLKLICSATSTNARSWAYSLP